jgi:hypothetical protein
VAGLARAHEKVVNLTRKTLENHAGAAAIPRDSSDFLQIGPLRFSLQPRIHIISSAHESPAGAAKARVNNLFFFRY